MTVHIMGHNFPFPTLGPQGRAKLKLVTPSTTVLNLVLGRPYWRYFHGQHDFGDESRSIAGDRRWRKIFHLKKSKTKINQTLNHTARCQLSSGKEQKIIVQFACAFTLSFMQRK